jgi:cytochrome c oxidase subunit II
MSIHSPEPGWLKMPAGGERLWVGLALMWCMVMTVAMPYWHFYGKQNPSGESYKVKFEDYGARVQQFIEAHQIRNESGELVFESSPGYPGVPVVEIPPGGDGYITARMWSWSPIIQMKKGQTYRLHLSSADLQHGFSLQPLNMNFQVLPGYDHVLTLRPTSSGVFPIICNEFCGIGHHMMTGRIIVVD